MKRIVCLAVAITSLTFIATTNANLLDDPSFELATDNSIESNSNWEFITDTDPETPEVQGGAFSESVWAASDGLKGVWFTPWSSRPENDDPPADATLTQTVTNVARGGTYQLSFDAARETNYLAEATTATLSSSGGGSVSVNLLTAEFRNGGNMETKPEEPESGPTRFTLTLPNVMAGENLTVSVTMDNGTFNMDPGQSFMVDNFDLDLLALQCDLNGDGAADAADAGIMFTNWGLSGAGDCNSDNIVDAADAGILFGEWTGDPVATPGTVAAEYNPATGEIKVAINDVVNWYIQSASNGLTGEAVGDLPGPGLVTDNNSRVGETALGKFTYNASLGNVAAPGLAQGDLTIYWNSALGQPLQNTAVQYIPEPMGLSFVLGLLSGAAVRRRRRRS